MSSFERWFSADGLLRFLVALACLAFLQTIFFGFVYDDFPMITMNPWLDSLAGLKAIFLHHSGAFDAMTPARHYRPIFLAWLWMIRNLLGAAPGFFHLVSLLTHLAASFAAYLFCRELMEGERRPAAMVALLFALHPTKVEPVAWISAANESLHALFFFVTLTCYIRARRTTGHKWPWLLLGSVAFACALGTKETAVIVPFVLLAWEVMVFRKGGERKPWKPALLCVAPLLATLVAFLMVRQLMLSGFGDQAAHQSFRQIVYTAPLAVWLLIRQLVWPVHMSTLYPITAVEEFSVRYFLVPLLALLALAIVYWRVAKGKPLLKFAAVWFALTILPVVAEFHWVQLHDRHLYLPSFAAGLMLVELLSRLKVQDPQRVAAMACVGLALVFTAVSAKEVRVWDSQISVFERAVEVAPNNSEAVEVLAQGYGMKGEQQRAEATLRSGLERMPNSARLKIALGSQLLSTGRDNEALPYLRQALAMELPPSRRAWVLFEVFQIDLKNGDREKALAELREAVKLTPEPGLQSLLKRMEAETN